MQLDAGGTRRLGADRPSACQLPRRHARSSRRAATSRSEIAPDRPAEIAPRVSNAARRSPLTLSHAGVSTSGDAEQWVEIGGVRYSHILDPRTGQPLTGGSSVTVVAGNATTSDMLATAVDVLGPEAGRRLVDGWAGASALIGMRDGTGDHWVTSRRFP